MDAPNGHANEMCDRYGPSWVAKRTNSHVPMWVAKVLAGAIVFMIVVIMLTVVS